MKQVLQQHPAVIEHHRLTERAREELPQLIHLANQRWTYAASPTANAAAARAAAALYGLLAVVADFAPTDAPALDHALQHAREHITALPYTARLAQLNQGLFLRPPPYALFRTWISAALQPDEDQTTSLRTAIAKWNSTVDYLAQHPAYPGFIRDEIIAQRRIPQQVLPTANAITNSSGKTVRWAHTTFNVAAGTDAVTDQLDVHSAGQQAIQHSRHHPG